MTAICVNYAERKIILSSAFVKKAFIPGTDEYKALQSVRNDFPDFALATRRFKTNTAQEHYRGLTYEFMHDYISTHEKDAKAVLEELDEMIGISKCHSLNKRYPTIKAWFLDEYKEIKEYADEIKTAKANKAAARNAEKIAKREEEMKKFIAYRNAMDNQVA